MTLVSSSAAGRHRLSRRVVAVIVTAEAVLAGVVGGVAIRGAVGYTIAGVAVLAAVLIAAGARGSWLSEAGSADIAPDQLLARLRVVGEVSRSTGEVGVIGDGQGYAAGLDIDAADGAVLGLDGLADLVCADPSRPSVLQVRVTSYSPPASRVSAARAANLAGVAVHRRVHVLLRLDPVWVSDVVARHGGGAQGARSALVAAVERLSVRLRRSGVANRVMDAGMLGALLAEDTAADLPVRRYVAEPGSSGDLRRLLNLLQRTGPERAVLSVCVDLAGNDQRLSRTALLVGCRDAEQAGVVQAALLADPAVTGGAPPELTAVILPLGGGPGRLTPALSLARSG